MKTKLPEGWCFYISTANLIGCISINTTINTVLHRFVSIHKHWQHPRIWVRADIEPQRKRFSVVLVHVHTHKHIVTYSVSPTTLITGHEHNVEERNVWYDLQPKCQRCTVVSRERETQRDRGVKWNLNVFVNHGENAVCVCQRERERRWERRRQKGREGDRRRVCSCSIVTNSRLLFILACDSQQPPHIRCEIGGGEEGVKGGGVAASKRSSLYATNLRFRTRHPPQPPNPS